VLARESRAPPRRTRVCARSRPARGVLSSQHFNLLSSRGRLPICGFRRKIAGGTPERAPATGAKPCCARPPLRNKATGPYPAPILSGGAGSSASAHRPRARGDPAASCCPMKLRPRLIPRRPRLHYRAVTRIINRSSAPHHCCSSPHEMSVGCGRSPPRVPIVLIMGDRRRGARPPPFFASFRRLPLNRRLLAPFDSWMIYCGD